MAVDDDPYHSIRERLESLAEELGDLAIENIRAQLDAGDTEGAKAHEKQVSKARRAVLKAAAHLS